jgi:hypothetical protein
VNENRDSWMTSGMSKTGIASGIGPPASLAEQLKQVSSKVLAIINKA